MNTYRKIRIDSPASREDCASLLVIYTGGTFGMVYEAKGKQLVPFDFEYVLERLPDLQRLDIQVTFLSLAKPIDSSDITPTIWAELAAIVQANYAEYDGFVILHGTDTMAYSASALSYMFANLNKPVILTGAQLPIGIARSDARENLLTALEIAAAQRENGAPVISEVCIYFNSYLFRGNRSKKKESSDFNAFTSENYPYLANAGVKIDYNVPFIRSADAVTEELQIQTEMDSNVTFLKLFPGLSGDTLDAVLQIPNLKGVVLETYGAGNTTTAEWFVKGLQKAVDRGILIYNVTQCEGGRVSQGLYQTSKALRDMGIISGSDITAEAAITKMMYVFGNYERNYVELLRSPLRGEMTV